MSKVCVRHRSFGCKTPIDHVRLKNLRRMLCPLVNFFMAQTAISKDLSDPITIGISNEITKIMTCIERLTTPTIAMNGPLRHIQRKHVRLDSFPEDIYNTTFRFHNADELRRIMDGLQFPL